MSTNFTYKANKEEIDKQIKLKYKKEFDEFNRINKLPEIQTNEMNLLTTYPRVEALTKWHEENDSKIVDEYTKENSRVFKNMLDLLLGRQVEIDNNISIIRVPGGWLYTTLNTTNSVFVPEPKK